MTRAQAIVTASHLAAVALISLMLEPRTIDEKERRQRDHGADEGGPDKGDIKGFIDEGQAENTDDHPCKPDGGGTSSGTDVPAVLHGE